MPFLYTMVHGDIIRRTFELNLGSNVIRRTFDLIRRTLELNPSFMKELFAKKQSL